MIRKISAGALVFAMLMTVNAGVAAATPATAPTPTEPMPITVHPEPNANTGQPPIEWTVWAAPHAIILQGKSTLFYTSPLTKRMSHPQRDIFGNPYRYSEFFPSKSSCAKDIKGRTTANALSPEYYIQLVEHDGQAPMIPLCYQIANGKWVYEYIQYGDPEKNKVIER